MSRFVSHRSLTLLFLLTWCGFLFFYGLGQGDLWRTESLRAIIAAEFLRTGNWIVPTLYGQPLLTKPPGMYAAIAAVSWPVGGVTEWTARLPSALAATALLLLFYWYFARQLGRTAGLVAALILPMSVMWLDKASAAEIDMLQVAWVGAAILFFLRGLESQSVLDPPSSILDSRLSWWLLSLLCVAGGVLTKWSAPAFFYATVIPLLMWRRQLRLLFSWPHLVGVAFAAGLCLRWVWLAGSMAGWDTFIETFHRELTQHVSPGLREETIQQMSASHHSRLGYWGETVVHPFKVLAMNLPWSVLAILALRPSFFARWDERGLRLLQALHCWVWPSLILWSVLPQHSPRHSFPLFPGIAGLAALVWWDWMRRGAAKPRAGLLNARPVLVGLVVLWLAVKVVFVEAIVPQRTEARETRAKGEQLAALVPADGPLYLCRVKDEGIMFYYGRTVLRLADFSRLPSISEPSFCILDAAEWQSFAGGHSADVLWHLHDEQGAPLVLVRVAPAPAIPINDGER